MSQSIPRVQPPPPPKDKSGALDAYTFPLSRAFDKKAKPTRLGILFINFCSEVNNKNKTPLYSFPLGYLTIIP